MRLLLVHNLHPDHPRAGGGQRVTHELAGALARRGAEVHALYLGDGRGEPPPGVTAHWLGSSGRLLLDAWRMGGRVRGLARSLALDVVHGSAPEAGGASLRLPAGVGLVGMDHHPSPPSLLDAPDGVVARLRWMRAHQARLLVRTLLGRAHRVVAVSRWGRDALREGGYLDPARPVAIIPNGIGGDWLDAAPVPATEESRPLLFAGRLDHQKGVDVLLRALATLPGAPALEVVGDGPDRAALESLAASLDLGGRVRFAGALPPARLRERMASAAALAVPSRYELFGRVVLEAMAVGAPVVASRVGGIPEVARDGREALLVPPDDPEALAAALARVLAEPTLSARLAAAGRERARAFAWDGVAGAMEKELEAAAAAAREGAVRGG